jgi:hypothetical protein
METGVRSRRFKCKHINLMIIPANFHDDFVYDDIVVRKTIAQKDSTKDNSNLVSGQTVTGN